MTYDILCIRRILYNTNPSWKNMYRCIQPSHLVSIAMPLHHPLYVIPTNKNPPPSAAQPSQS